MALSKLLGSGRSNAAPVMAILTTVLLVACSNSRTNGDPNGGTGGTTDGGTSGADGGGDGGSLSDGATPRPRDGSTSNRDGSLVDNGEVCDGTDTNGDGQIDNVDRDEDGICD